jgi:hypothetical protein
VDIDLDAEQTPYLDAAVHAVFSSRPAAQRFPGAARL